MTEVAPLHLRPAALRDARVLWEWRNDLVTRTNSFHQEPIVWETHLRWLQDRLAAPDTRIYILKNEGEPVGQIRCDRQGELAYVGLVIAAGFRGRGFGTRLLALAAPLACAELQVAALVGIVKQDNAASRKAFERAGFRRVREETREGAACVIYEWACTEPAPPALAEAEGRGGP